MVNIPLLFKQPFVYMERLQGSQPHNIKLKAQESRVA